MDAKIQEAAKLGFRFGRDKAEFGRSSENVQDSIFRAMFTVLLVAMFGAAGRKAGESYRESYRTALRAEAGERAGAEFDKLGSDSKRREALKEWKRTNGNGILNATAYLIAAWFGTAPRFSECLTINDAATDDADLQALIRKFLDGEATAQDVKNYDPAGEEDAGEDADAADADADANAPVAVEEVTAPEAVENMLRRVIAQAVEVLGEARTAEIWADAMGITVEEEAAA